ncbi:Transcription regulator [Vulcanisaeta moutnovskia 768-28]|uniref:Transcription regulator n=2 Tax=Vulcanisaeta TaxID=164450 RepID=F0QT78_VULM7|nr:Transcription regulator [Vulcanisaeta moutnovskia 768-28]
MRRGHGNDSLLLDDLDHEILRILEEDCTLTYHEIAKRVGRSPWTVRHRIERLRRMGIIKGCRAVVDYKALSYSEVILFFNVPPRTWRRLGLHEVSGNGQGIIHN